jgi:hypothetical protein
MNALKLTCGDAVLYAVLHYGKAPRLVAGLEKQFPVTGFVRHARVCDMEWELPVSFTLDSGFDENLRFPKCGDIVYFRPSNMICGWYGDADYAPPLSECAVFATLREDCLHAARELFSSVWFKADKLITLEIADDGTGGAV